MRKISSLYPLIACLSLLALMLIVGCSSSGGSAPQTGAVPMNAITTPSPDGNVQAVIGGVTVNSPPVVTFALSDENGSPLDPQDLLKVSTNRIRFYIARLDASGNYTNYILDASGLPTYDGSGSNTKGTFATVSPGVYTYTFGANIRSNALFDAAQTHTAAIQILRNTTKNGKAFQQISNPYFNFRPDGATVTATREVVSISACNECHGKLGVHGGSRIEIALCILCHNANAALLSSGASIDMKAMIHKIHMGGNLPSKAYFMNATFKNFSTVGYPLFSTDAVVTGTPVECVKCHKAGTNTAGKPYDANVDNWKTKPAIAACATCHNTTSFTITGSGTATVDGVANVAVTGHSGGIQADGTCAGCHPSSGASYDISVPGAHTVFEDANAAKTPVLKILSASNVAFSTNTVNAMPTVTFQITDSAGNPIAPDTAAAAPFKNSIQLKWAIKPGATADFANTTTGSPTLTAPYTYGFGSSGTAVSLTISGNANSAAAKGKLGTIDANRGIYFVNLSSAAATFATPAKYVLPQKAGDYANGATIAFALQGARSDQSATHYGTATARALGGKAIPAYFDLDTGAPALAASQARRQTTVTDSCNGCHKNLVAFHGGSRPNVEFCVMCHTPNNGFGTVAGDFKVFIHKIHRGVNLADQTYSFAGISGILYPNDLRRCTACHNAANPSVTITSATIVGSPAIQNLQPWNAVCTACHDTTSGTIAGASGGAVGHANANPGVLPSGDQVCIQCHSDSLRALGHQLPD